MKKINKPSLSSAFCAFYELFMFAVDDLGRKWRYKTSPKKGRGVIGYFNKLSELIKYSDQVQDMANIYDGKLTKTEIKMAIVLLR